MAAQLVKSGADATCLASALLQRGPAYLGEQERADSLEALTTYSTRQVL